MLRKFLGAGRAKNGGGGVGRPVTESASPFVTASMQGVIEKLRAQEKELARLHLLAQERAQESERLTEEVTRNMPTGLLLVNATGAIASTNPAAEEALGIRPLRYRSYKEVLGAESELARMLGECLASGRTFQRGEVEHLTTTGETRRLGVTISPIYRSGRTVSVRAKLGDPSANDRRASGALCLMSDLTELAALQKQIRWKENLAALGEMSAGIAHEFKNALATISGYAQMIHSEAKTGDIHDSSGKILEQTRSLAHVVTEFLRFAKPLEICYEPVELEALVERVADELREGAPGCAVTCEGTFSELPGDEALIRQALVNLTRNAAEAVRGGQHPRVAIFGTIEDLGGRKWQRIGIADNGAGIAEHDLPKIFLPFYTTKSDGTGLGLAVVQKVALQHGGSIEARNRAEGGAEFLLWLPLRHEPVASVMGSGQGASKL
jgi:two-component system sensor histidine kinase HydH